MPLRSRAILAALAAAAPLVAAVGTAGAAAPPEIHAHRGGTVVNGKPTFAEETLLAYRSAARQGFVLEVDAKLTRDGVPVAIHDATLDRTTTCTGLVRSFTRAALRRCRFDVLGSPDGGVRTRSVSPRGTIPTIAEVLELARLTGAKVNLEIKNVPTDPDYDTTSAYANRVMNVVRAAGLPRSRLLIQSFIPANLDVAKRRMPRVSTILLALNASAEGIQLARANGYRWISPRWPVTSPFVREAHRLDRLVAPYTLNEGADVRAAGRAGVDAVITDDPSMAASALGLRPVRALRTRLSRRAGRVEVEGRLLPPRGLARRKGCTGRVTLRVLGSNRTLHARGAQLRGDCAFELSVLVPRGAPARLLATIGFGGNERLLPRLVGPRPVPREVPLAVPHAG